MRPILRLTMTLILTGLVLTTAFVAGFGVNYYVTQTQASSSVIPGNFGIFWEAWKIVKGEYYGTMPTPQALTHGAIRGMLLGLGDPHTVFIEPESAKSEQSSLQGETGDVGLNLDMRDHLLVILSPIPNSPAEKAGFQSGDIIMKIGDKTITPDVTVHDAQVLLRGTIDSQVSITVHRVGETKPITALVTRSKYALPTVNAKVLPDTTFGYIKVMMETAETANEFAKAIETLKSQHVTALVVDLRNNPGGLFPDPVLDMAGQFLKNSDVVVYEKYRDGTEKSYNAGNRREAVDLPLVLLVNNGTASAAEIFAGALGDYKRAVLIGEPTYGKGSVQSVRQLSDGSAVHITVATWYTPKHTQIEGKGLQPDISVALTNEDTQKSIDTQLNRAIDYLRKNP
jgi:carboxyl-terminal processing protease